MTLKITDDVIIGNYHKTIFNNGLTIVSEFVPEIRSFAAGVCLNIGSRNDWKGKEGIAHFMEHAAFRRTKNRTSKQIANEFEVLGAYSNAFTTKELTCFYVRAIKEHFAETFELLSDVTLNTLFVENEIEKEKLVILEEIKSYEDDPEEYVCDLADTLIFAESPLAAPIVGTQNSVGNINYLDLENFHNEFYKPYRMTIAVAGNIEHNLIVQLSQKYFDVDLNNPTSRKKVTSSNKKENCNKEEDCNKKEIMQLAQKSKKLDKTKELTSRELTSKELVVVKQIQQAHIIIGKLTNGIRHSERYPLAVANAIFGDGMSSRLYQNLREKYGLAYSIYSSLQSYSDCGAINIYAATEENKDAKTIDLVFEEMKKFISTHKPKKNELTRAKEQLKTATIIELESMSSRMQNLLKQTISIGKMESIPEIISNIENIKFDDIMNIVEEYFSSDNWNICKLLPENQP